jgi:DNA-binding response OmpR family regulator
MTSILAGRPILIVEDEPFIALDIANRFETAGAVVMTALSHDRALELLEGYDWAGAVVGYGLDGRDGSQICEWMLKRAVPLVIYTGFDKVMGACASGVQIAKPANLDDIVRTLERLAARHAAGRT